MDTERRHPSLWQATEPGREHAPLTDDTTVEVLVAGGGITGLTTGLLLAEAGRRVAVVEARRLGAGATGGTTGKVTSQHGAIYHRLVEQHGEDVARTYGQANQAALGLVRALVARYGIDAADLRTADAYVHTEREDLTEQLEHEAEVARGLGLPAEWTTSTDLPFPVAGAVRFADQARIHAIGYLHGLADAIAGHPNASVHEQTRVTGLTQRGGEVLVATDRGVVIAGEVVLATLVPITDRGLEFARVEPARTYGIAARLRDDGLLPGGMYLSLEEPTRSTRRYDGPDGSYLVVVGDAHRTGVDRDTDRHHAALERYARERFGATDVVHRWSAQDFVPVDLLPFVGRTPFASRVSVATGFNKWGLTGGTLAAEILRDQLLGEEHPAARAFAPRRLSPLAAVRPLIEHNVESGVHFVVDRLRPDAHSIADIPPGGAGIVREGARFLAVSREADGTASIRSAVCSHLGCLVQWNAGERSWDCPCHGSRFDVDGSVLEGPASGPLAPGSGH